MSAKLQAISRKQYTTARLPRRGLLPFAVKGTKQ